MLELKSPPAAQNPFRDILPWKTDHEQSSLSVGTALGTLLKVELHLLWVLLHSVDCFSPSKKERATCVLLSGYCGSCWTRPPGNLSSACSSEPAPGNVSPSGLWTLLLWLGPSARVFSTPHASTLSLESQCCDGVDNAVFHPMTYTPSCQGLPPEHNWEHRGGLLSPSRQQPCWEEPGVYSC